MNDIPGLPARRAALKMGDAVLRRGETLDQAAGAAMQHLRAPADRALARAIVAEVLRWLVDLDALIGVNHWFETVLGRPMPSLVAKAGNWTGAAAA